MNIKKVHKYTNIYALFPSKRGIYIFNFYNFTVSRADDNIIFIGAYSFWISKKMHAYPQNY